VIGSNRVLEEWTWAVRTLLLALDRDDAVQAVRELAAIAATQFTGEPDHWSRLWQLAQETDDFLGGDRSRLVASSDWIAGLRVRESVP
jgi:hypothetical protein